MINTHIVQAKKTIVDDNNKVIVSVVIPTRNRPQIVTKAVKSALAQTLQAIEVIVVIDGPDAATVNSLSQIDDSRLKVIELRENRGAAEARNSGIREAQGTWIALLDDDDQWLPHKLKSQLEVAEHSDFNFPIVTSRFIAHTEQGEFIWPRRLPNFSEPLCEYLFVRNSLFKGETGLATSTIFTKKQLLQNIPFNKDLPRHQDLDFLLRAIAIEGVEIEFLDEPTAIVNVIHSKKAGRKSLSNINDWQYSLNWMRSIFHLVTPRAYSGFIAIFVSVKASSEGDWKAFFPLLWEAISRGQLRPLDFLLYLNMWLMPQDFRQKIRFMFTKKMKT